MLKVQQAEVSVLDAVISGLEAVTAALRELRDAKQAAPPSSIATSNPKPAFDFTRHNPEWKNGPRLTRLGRIAIRAAYAAGLTQAEVSRLFRIGPNSAHTYALRCQGKLSWPGDQEPGATAQH